MANLWPKELGREVLVRARLPVRRLGTRLLIKRNLGPCHKKAIESAIVTWVTAYTMHFHSSKLAET
jgi:hypothetical protein